MTTKLNKRGRPRLSDHEKVLALLWGGFSQDEAADYFGITQQAVSLIATKAREEGHPLAPPLGGVRPPVASPAIEKALGATFGQCPEDTLDYGHDPDAARSCPEDRLDYGQTPALRPPQPGDFWLRRRP